MTWPHDWPEGTSFPKPHEDDKSTSGSSGEEIHKISTVFAIFSFYYYYYCLNNIEMQRVRCSVATEETQSGIRRTHRKEGLFTRSWRVREGLLEVMTSQTGSEGRWLVMQDIGGGRKRQHSKHKEYKRT